MGDSAGSALPALAPLARSHTVGGASVLSSADPDSGAASVAHAPPSLAAPPAHFGRTSRVLSRLLLRKSPSEGSVNRASPAEQLADERAAADWETLVPVVDPRLLPKMDAVEDVRLHLFLDRTVRVPPCNYSCHKRCEVKVMTGSHRECACSVTRPRRSGDGTVDDVPSGASSDASAYSAAASASEGGCDGGATTDVSKDGAIVDTPENDQHAADTDSSLPVPGGVTGLVNEQHLPRTKKRTIVDTIRSTVAKNRARYVTEDFDLDLSYITDKIIAYRNHVSDVARMLNEKHPEKYLIFNLSEKFYDISKFNNQVLDFGWPDHHAPPLEMLFSICMSIDSWLKSDDENVVVVHCKGGKGRTGTVVCCHMIYSRTCDTADEAMELFASRRFVNGKEGGITQPSQKRYVRYFEQIITGELLPTDQGLLLDRIIVNRVPNFDGRGGCRPVLRVYQNFKLLFDSRQKHHGKEVGPRAYTSDMEFMCFDFAPEGLEVTGDILIRCQHGSQAKETIFRLQFHTGCVVDYYLKFTKTDLDDAVLEKRFPDDGGVDILFRPPPPTPRHVDIESIIDSYSTATTGSDVTGHVLGGQELTSPDSEDDDFTRYRYSLDTNYSGMGGLSLQLSSALAIARGASKAHEAASLRRAMTASAPSDVVVDAVGVSECACAEDSQTENALPSAASTGGVDDDTETNPFDD